MSQGTHQPIFCGAVDSFGDTLWERDRHRFRSWTDAELADMDILPEFFELYRRIESLYEVSREHRTMEIVFYEDVSFKEMEAW